MLIAQDVGHHLRPQVICDWCHQRITDFVDGEAVYVERDADDPMEHLQVFHAHADCRKPIYRMQGPHVPETIEYLGNHLVRLMIEAKMTPEEVADAHRQLAQSPRLYRMRLW